MCKILIGFALMLTLVVLPAWAASRREHCTGAGLVDSDTQIKDCTTLIQSGHETRDNLLADYNSRGAAYLHKSDHDRAIADFTQEIRLNPNLALAYANRGYAYDLKGEHDRAIADETQAIRLNPKDANAYFLRGHAYEAKGNHDRAIDDYYEAGRLNPNYVGPLYNHRGNAHGNNGD